MAVTQARSVLDLGEAGWDGLARMMPESGGYLLERWTGPAGDDLLPALAAVLDGMNDAPRDAGVEAKRLPVDRIRATEERMRRDGEDCYSMLARRASDGAPAGITRIYLDAQPREPLGSPGRHDGAQGAPRPPARPAAQAVQPVLAARERAADRPDRHLERHHEPAHAGDQRGHGLRGARRVVRVAASAMTGSVRGRGRMGDVTERTALLRIAPELLLFLPASRREPQRPIVTDGSPTLGHHVESAGCPADRGGADDG
ncbi:hypothetical protein ACFSTC_42685 [Nonomuraea ferruginea]